MSAETETFLVILTHEVTSSCQAFLWQGTYEEAYRLAHDSWNVSVFLLMPEPRQSWSGYGQQLVNVCSLHSNMAAKAHAKMAAYELRRMSPEQRRKDLQWIRQMIETESQDSNPQTYPSSREGDLQRLADLGITPLNDDQIEALRR